MNPLCHASSKHGLQQDAHFSTACGSSRTRTLQLKQRRQWRPSSALPIRAESNPSQPKVLVIGAGAGGLATAARLGKQGCQVTLLEKNQLLGGRIQSQHLPGHRSRSEQWRFDTGPSLLLFPDKYYETFNELDLPLETLVNIKKVEPAAYRVFFPSSKFQLDLLYDVEAMADQLEALEPGAGDGYRRFLDMARNHLELGMPNFIERDFTELKDAKGLMDLLPKLSSINPWKLLGPHDLVMRLFFKDPRLRAAFTFQDLYVGLTPKNAPAVFSLLAGTELTDGVCYPIGGFEKIRDALALAANNADVAIRNEAEVESIEVNDKEQVTGVTLKTGEFLPADVVVCNRDLPAAYAGLFKNAKQKNQSVIDHAIKKAGQLLKMKYSAGIIAYNWCVRGQLPQLSHHNVFLCEEFDRAWRLAGTPDELPRHPNFYVHVPNRTDPSAAPEGCDSVMVLLPVQASAMGDYSSLVSEGRKKIIEAFRDAGVGDVEPMIEHQTVISPPQWAARFGLEKGAAFGLSHGLDQLSLFRPANKDEVIKGLYFVGASTRPGNGVPLCLIGAKLTAERVMKDWKNDK